jgi:hypothetical protein
MDILMETDDGDLEFLGTYGKVEAPCRTSIPILMVKVYTNV